MKEFVEMFIIGILDALEEFFNALTSPSTQFTLEAFLVSLGFTVVAIICNSCKIFCFIGVDEAIVCNVLMLIVVLVDTGTRTSINNKLKDITQRLKKKGGYSDEE